MPDKVITLNLANACCCSGATVELAGCRHKSGSDSIGPRPESGSYYARCPAIHPGEPQNPSGGTVGRTDYFQNPIFPYAYDKEINWTFSFTPVAGMPWTYVVTFSATLSGAGFAGVSLVGIEFITGAPSGAEVTLAPCTHLGAGMLFVETSEGGYFCNRFDSLSTGRARGPSVSDGEAYEGAIEDKLATAEWESGGDCMIELTAPNATTGDYTFHISQARALCTGLYVGHTYAVTFYYQQWNGSAWVDYNTVSATFVAEEDEETTDYVDAWDHFRSPSPIKLRLHPTAPVTIAHLGIIE